MTVRASIAQEVRRRGSRRTRSRPIRCRGMDLLKERCVDVLLPSAAARPRQGRRTRRWRRQGYFRPVQYPGVQGRQGLSRPPTASTWSSTPRRPKEKQEALHDLYKFMMSDLVDCLEGRRSLHVRAARADGLTIRRCKKFPYVNEIITRQGRGRVPAALPGVQ